MQNLPEGILTQEVPKNPLGKLRSFSRSLIDEATIKQKPTIEEYDELDDLGKKVFDFFKLKHWDDTAAMKQAQKDMEARKIDDSLTKALYEIMRPKIFASINELPSSLLQIIEDFIGRDNGYVFQLWKNNQLNSYEDIKKKWDEMIDSQ
jgi:hypothetical protein